jgi:hypothetical protein
MAETSINITIDGTEYGVMDRDQEAGALIRLAGKDPKDVDLFLVAKNGVETRIHDNQIVDLREGEKFVTRERVRFTIDGEQFTSFDDDQDAAALMRLAGIDPAAYDLARVLRGGGSETFKDTDIVRIHDGDDFVTAKHVGGVA